LALVIPVMSGYSATFVDVNRNEKLVSLSFIPKRSRWLRFIRPQFYLIFFVNFNMIFLSNI
jgi:hypothetical protein